MELFSHRSNTSSIGQSKIESQAPIEQPKISAIICLRLNLAESTIKTLRFKAQNRNKKKK